MSEPAELAALRAKILGQIDQWLAISRDDRPWTTAPGVVSAWPPLVHAEHMALAGLGSVSQLDKALEREGGPPIRLMGRLVLLLGWIPRGIGKAPATTAPKHVERVEVTALLEALRTRVTTLDLERIASGRGRAHHPAFGGFTARQWFRFLDIHHRHHLRIVRDLKNAARPG
jgi:hypothetical protein